MSINDLLKRTGETESTVVRGHVILTGHAKLSRYEAECAHFRNKYGMSLETFKGQVESKRNEEDFHEEDDLLDWEYAEAALKWWREQIKELQHAH